MDATVLSDLCGTCYIEKPKYRCPRCRTQTCSLPCYKKHQQRASCSGKRDSTAYVKKSKWATPDGIDHDYNYLKGIERTIDDAGNDSKHRGIGVDVYATKSVGRARKTDSSVQKYLIKNRIDVNHAPKGMTRQKTNCTRLTKSGHVVWTVEWVDVTGNHDVQHDALESSSISEIRKERLTERRNAEKREAKLNGVGVKRKRGQDRDGTMLPSKAEANRQPSNTAGSQVVHHGNFAADALVVKQQTHTYKARLTLEKKESTEDAVANTGVSESEAVENNNDLEDNRSEDSSSEVDIIVDPNDRPAPPLRYYLLKPATASAFRVLIPIDSRASLTASLQDRTVLEYPTIYLLPNSPEHLPPGFVLEQDYVKRTPQGPQVHAPLSTAERSGPHKADDRNESDAGLVDAQSILDMLKRDVRL